MWRRCAVLSDSNFQLNVCDTLDTSIVDAVVNKVCGRVPVSVRTGPQLVLKDTMLVVSIGVIIDEIMAASVGPQ